MLKVWAAESYFGPTLRCSSPHLPDIKACVTDNTPTGANTPSPRSQHFHDCRETAETRVWTSAFETFFFLHVTMRWLLAGYCGLALISISGKY